MGSYFNAPIFSRKGLYKHSGKTSGEPKFFSKGDMVHLKGVSQQKQKSLNYPNLLLIVRPVHPCDEIHFPVFTLLLELTKYDSFEGDKDTDHEFCNFHGACSSH